MIITFDQLRQESKYQEDYASKWRARYASNPELKKAADKIHNAGMLSSPACTLCIEAAAIKLGIETDHEQHES